MGCRRCLAVAIHALSRLQGRRGQRGDACVVRPDPARTDMGAAARPRDDAMRWCLVPEWEVSRPTSDRSRRWIGGGGGVCVSGPVLKLTEGVRRVGDRRAANLTLPSAQSPFDLVSSAVPSTALPSVVNGSGSSLASPRCCVSTRAHTFRRIRVRADGGKAGAGER